MLHRNVALVALGIGLVGCLSDYADGPRFGRNREVTEPDMGSEPPAPPPARRPGPSPEFGPTVRLEDSPPPLSGGTLAVAPDGFTVVAADPDRDRVSIVDLRAPAVVKTVALAPHDEPARIAVDGSGRAHVVLRSGGAVVTIDLATGAILERRAVCSAPRGIAHDSVTDRLFVACAGGELVTLAAVGGAPLSTRVIMRDLRDVVVLRSGLVLSTFREAKTYWLANESAEPLERTGMMNAGPGIPRVGWRMVVAKPPPGSESDGDGVVVAGQMAAESAVETPAEYYPADDCSASGPVTLLTDRRYAIRVPSAVLPVDVAVSASTMVVVAAGNAHTPSLPQLVFLARQPGPEFSPSGSLCSGIDRGVTDAGQITSVAFAEDDSVLVALSREPAELLLLRSNADDATRGEVISRIPLGGDSREDTGHAIFHSNSGGGVACASCHPDGRDDGHAWLSNTLGRRRTPSLLGTLAGTAPYHWNGEARTMTELMELTFQGRMLGPVLRPDQMDAVGGWLTALRAPPAAHVVNAASRDRGQLLFEGAAKCAQCHAGARRTNNTSVNVGTGGVFQVPSLVGVSWRAPYLHDGRAPSIPALLRTGHGGGPLSAEESADVASYLDTF